MNNGGNVNPEGMRMTIQRMLMLAGALAVAWLAAAVRRRKRMPQRDDESGIRVKKGSVTITTLSNGGFEPDGSDWKTKKTAGISYDLTVVATPNTTWTGPNPLREFKSLTFKTKDGAEHAIKVSNGRFRTKLNKTWTLENFGCTLRHPVDEQKLSSLKAKGGHGLELECKFGGSDDDEVAIDIYP